MHGRNSSNLPRSALSATRHCSAKPLKHRAALQLLRTTVAASALQLRAPSLLQLLRCAAADTTWPKEKKTRRPDSAAGRAKGRPHRKKKKNSTPTRAAGAGSSMCKGDTRTVTARRRAATHYVAACKDDTAAPPHDPRSLSMSVRDSRRWTTRPLG